MRKKILVSVLLAFVFGAPLHGQSVTVVKAKRLIDGTGTAPIENAVVVITGDKITAVGTSGSVAIPANAKTIDLGGAILLPGLIDSHTHLVGRVLGEEGWNESTVRDLNGYSAVRAVGHAEKTLLSGITTVRNVGAGLFHDVALMQAIDEGHVKGPRMQTAAHGLGITGGHCDDNGYRPGIAVNTIADGIADGPDQVRAAVRYQVKYGATVIKTCATGGVLSEGDAVGNVQYSYEELKAMVDEATNHDRKVAAHAHGAEGIKIASRAGVASIEHGSFLDEEGAKLMAQKGTYLVPTLSAVEAVERAANTGVLKGLRAEKARAAAAAARKGIKIAIANKVPIAMGTDAGVIPHGTNAHELELMVSWGGMKPMDAIVASTASSARLLGWDKQVGTITAGKWADLIAVTADPLADIAALRDVSWVMKGGVVYKGMR